MISNIMTGSSKDTTSKGEKATKIQINAGFAYKDISDADEIGL